MSPVRTTARRTVGRAFGLYPTAFSVAAALAAAMALFVFDLSGSGGTRLSVSALWTTAIAPVLPVLAALLGMGAWSGEVASGRDQLLLASPVRERDLVVGKFLGVWALVMATVLAFAVLAVLLLYVHASAPVPGLSLFSFLPAVFALGLQGACWSAVAVASSVFFRQSAMAACATVAVLVAIPRAAWMAVASGLVGMPLAVGVFPPDAHALDLASGVVSTGVVAGYGFLTVLMLFLATKRVAISRFAGRGAALRRASTRLAEVLAVALAVLAAALAVRLNVVVDLPLGAVATFSDRTRGIFAETSGEISVTCFMRRRDPRFRETAHFLRALAGCADSAGGVRLRVSYVDPHWSLGQAARLVREGVPEGALVLRRGRRTVTVPAHEATSERACASAVLRLTTPPQRRNVCWTRGHGEASFEDYGAFGLSDIARELARDGYGNLPVALDANAKIPSDCALVVVAGAKEEFSRAECARLDAYLNEGGRLLVLTDTSDAGGVAALLPTWGIRPAAASAASDLRTLTGTDVIVSDFAEHPATTPLRGAQVVFERPALFAPSAAAAAGTGADRLEFTALASSGGACCAAAVERGAGIGTDLALRPTRIVVIGDASFILNGQLASRANANGDFFLNCVAYLSGTDASTAGGSTGGALLPGLDRAARLRLVLDGVVAVPGTLFLVLFTAAWRRRRRT